MTEDDPKPDDVLRRMLAMKPKPKATDKKHNSAVREPIPNRPGCDNS